MHDVAHRTPQPKGSQHILIDHSKISVRVNGATRSSPPTSHLVHFISQHRCPASSALGLHEASFLRSPVRSPHLHRNLTPKNFRSLPTSVSLHTLLPSPFLSSWVLRVYGLWSIIVGCPSSRAISHRPRACITLYHLIRILIESFSWPCVPRASVPALDLSDCY